MKIMYSDRQDLSSVHYKAILGKLSFLASLFGTMDVGSFVTLFAWNPRIMGIFRRLLFDFE